MPEMACTLREGGDERGRFDGRGVDLAVPLSGVRDAGAVRVDRRRLAGLAEDEGTYSSSVASPSLSISAWASRSSRNEVDASIADGGR